MSVADRPPEFLPDGAGVAGAYRERAAALRSKSTWARKSKRYHMATEAAKAAPLVERAAASEAADPTPQPFEVSHDHRFCCGSSVPDQPSDL